MASKKKAAPKKKEAPKKKAKKTATKKSPKKAAAKKKTIKPKKKAALKKKAASPRSVRGTCSVICHECGHEVKRLSEEAANAERRKHSADTRHNDISINCSQQ
ncbi:hypothetical protein WG954_12125 [Lacibacter sp. H375]|uniref:hypothetical protein n=1 Tax=Lacibacter sp. H375 TaxID=3133424 RepID=UPI0030BCEE64